jgi:hypothetical protein
MAGTYQLKFEGDKRKGQPERVSAKLGAPRLSTIVGEPN